MTTTMSAHAPLVLVVDDSATSRVVIEKQLKKLGCNVTVARDGTSGLAAIVQTEFDLVLLDCQMPDMSGYDVAKLAREQKNEGPYTPIIAISAETDMEHKQRCLESGMDGVLGKSFPVAGELKKILSLWCNFDLVAASSTEIDAMENIELQTLFRTISLEDLNTMQTLVQSDIPGVGRMAHRMKGAALTMGAAEIVATLERIEAIIAANGTSLASSLRTEIGILRQQCDVLEKCAD
ncbi:MAG TPA: response regulator [Herbaspirillum sp.]|nr:response regulator [Herbaspirillum sp.]